MGKGSRKTEFFLGFIAGITSVGIIGVILLVIFLL